MAISKVVLASIADVQNMSDAKCLNAMRVLSMVPIAQVKSTREDLVWVAIRNFTK